jgi:molecular chaperone DnaJ
MGAGGPRFRGASSSGGGGFQDIFSGMFGAKSGTTSSINLEDILGSFGSGYSKGGSSFNPFGGTFSKNPYNDFNAKSPKMKSANVSISFDQAVNGVTVKVQSTNIKLPAGINDGQSVKAKLKDGSTVNIKVSVKKDLRFALDGNNILLTLPITYLEAILGANVDVKGFDGSKTTIKIPAGTQSEQKFRIKGKGVPAKKGDMIVMVKVKIPTKLKRNEKKLLNELNKLSNGENPREL